MTSKGRQFNKGEETVETDPHSILSLELADANKSTYENEAGYLLKNRKLTKNLGKFIVDFFITEDIAGYKLFNPDFPNEVLASMEGPLPRFKEEKVANLIELLAHSEATAIIDSE